MLKPKIVCLVGPNGAGKEYLCQNIIPVAGVPHRIVGVSSLLNGVTLPPAEQKRRDSGKLVSDDYVLDLIEQAVEDHSTNHAGQVLILDGFPRNYRQAAFVKINFNWDNTAILHIDASREVCYQQTMLRRKTKKARKDDNPGAFAERWAVYENEVLPAIRILGEDFPLCVVYGGIGIPEEMKLAPILRMFKKIGIPLICGDNISIDDVCGCVESISRTSLYRFTKKHPKILEECPHVRLWA